MNCGMPTESAASRPCASRTVALRSFDWLRIGVVAVRETYSAISKQTVSMPPRMTSAVTRSTVGASEMRPRLPGEAHQVDVRHWLPPREQLRAD